MGMGMGLHAYVGYARALGGGYEHGHRHMIAWVYGGWVNQGY